MQGFTCFMQSGLRLGEKGGNVVKWGSLWLSQMLYDGFYFRLEEGASLGVVVHGLQLLHEHGASLNPSVEGLLSGFGTAAWLVEQSQFGLAIGTIIEHK